MPTIKPVHSDSKRADRVQAAGRGSGLSSDLRGATQLTIAGVSGIVDMVEAVHNTIARRMPSTGITRLVYRGIRGITKLTGAVLDTAFAAFTPLIDSNAKLPKREREIALAALNGAFGDYLASTGNPLAITMRLRHKGQPVELRRDALAQAYPSANGKLLLLIHGLCMNDQQWLRDGHDHGAALAGALGFTPLYLHYNSGLHISSNGQMLAALLDQLHRQWPTAINEIVIIGHSMGGLVARSACHYGAKTSQAWLGDLRKIIFIGTPHHGAPLERAGSWVDLLLGISPYSAPFARLGLARSAGIQDLRHGALLDDDWQSRAAPDQNSNHAAAASSRKDLRSPVPLPLSVRCFAIAASKQARGANANALPRRGDGLVPVASALGLHKMRKFSLEMAPEQRWIGFEMNHFDLLSRTEVFDQMRTWLATDEGLLATSTASSESARRL